MKLISSHRWSDTNRAALALAGAVALIIATPASATDSVIVPGVGIGGVALGTTAGQVESRLGKGFIDNGHASFGGSEYIEFGWNFSSWAVVFRKAGRSYRVVQVSTTLRGQKTSEGVGPGTLWLKLVHTYPGGLCAFGNSLGLPSTASRGRYTGAYIEYLVPHRGGTQTIYTMQRVPDKTDPNKTANFFVLEVHVRVPFYALPEFAPKAPYRCKPGWDKTAVPEIETNR